MVAYGNARHVSPSFYLKVFLLFVPFTLIPSALGSMAILVVTRYLHRCVFKWALFGLSAVGIAYGVAFFEAGDGGEPGTGTDGGYAPRVTPQQQRDRSADTPELLGGVEHDCLGRRLVGEGSLLLHGPPQQRHDGHTGMCHGQPPPVTMKAGRVTTARAIFNSASPLLDRPISLPHPA